MNDPVGVVDIHEGMGGADRDEDAAAGVEHDLAVFEREFMTTFDDVEDLALAAVGVERRPGAGSGDFFKGGHGTTAGVGADEGADAVKRACQILFSALAQ